MKTPKEILNEYLPIPNQDMKDFVPFLHTSARGNVLEIGVCAGVSTSAFLLGMDEKQDGHLWSIDINPECASILAHPRWTFVCGDSTTIPLEQFPKLDILMIDGCHLHPVIDSDLERFSPLVRPGGMIFVHDIYPLAKATPEMIAEGWGAPDVNEAYYSFVNKNNYEHYELRGLYGLGVIVKDDR